MLRAYGCGGLEGLGSGHRGEGVCHSSVLHLLEKLVGGVLVAVLLHFGQVALLGGDCCIHLQNRERCVTHKIWYAHVHQGCQSHSTEGKVSAGFCFFSSIKT